MPKIKDVLTEGNPWWKNEFTIDYQHRQIFTEIKNFLSMPQLIALTGLNVLEKPH